MCEKKYGSLKEYKNCFFMCIGTGIGGAFFYNDELVTGGEYPGYEIGHMIIEKNGKLCKCGKRGCFEAYASMKNFGENVRNKLGIEKEINGKELFEILKNDESYRKVEMVVNEFIADLSIGISNIINIFEPEAISIGGSFAYYEEHFLDKINEFMKKQNLIYNKSKKTKIVMASMQNDAGIIGACM